MLSDLAFALARGKANIHVVTSRLRYEHSQQLLPNAQVMDEVTVHRVWTSGFGRRGLVGRALDYLSFYFTSFWCLLRLLRRGDVVVAMTDPPMVSVIARWAATVRGALLVNWVQDLFPEVAAELGVSIAKGWLGRMLIVLRDEDSQSR